MLLTISDTLKISNLLLDKKVGVMPTDTIYGLHCLANDLASIDRIYQIKQRPDKMPFITLVENASCLVEFGVSLNDFLEEQINIHWPGPNTLIFKLNDGSTRSFRQPNNIFLQEILSQTGPLISTSSNIHGQPSAISIQEAQKYFDTQVDFYVDAGILNNPPSSVYDLSQNSLIKLR